MLLFRCLNSRPPRLYGGLEQPMTNWAKPKVQRWTNQNGVSELGGKWYSGLPGHRGIIARGIQVRGLGYI